MYPYLSIQMDMEWSWTPNPNWSTCFVAMIFSCDLESKKASIFVFLNYIFIWKSIAFSFFSYCWRLLRFTSKWSSYPPPSFFQPNFLNRWQWCSSSLHLSFCSLGKALYVISIATSLCEHLCCDGYSGCWDIFIGASMAIVFLSSPLFHFFFPSLEAPWCSFCCDLFDFPFFWCTFSRNYSNTQASSTNLGLNNIICLCRWLCRSLRYLRSTFGLFGEIPNIMAIFLNSIVYSCTLCPCLNLK